MLLRMFLYCVCSAYEIPNSKDKLPLVTGKVGGKSAEVLRDTGCTGVIAKRGIW